MRVAAVDCGTNSLRLLVLERGPDGRVRELERRLVLVRLGQGVDASGEFAPEALARTFAALDEYAGLVARLDVQRCRFVATSAARDARNVDEFRAGVQARLGVPAEIIGGDEEAALTFAGALAGVPGAAEPVLVSDIGGGSTELVVGGTHGIDAAASLDIGSVRLRERFLHDDPPTPDQVAAAAGYVDELLAGRGPDLTGVRSWIGVAGTSTSLGALHLGLPRYDRDRVQGLVLDRADIRRVTAPLLETPSAALVSELLPPLRASVIAGGALICELIAARVEVPMTISENDLLDGIAAGLLDAGDVDSTRVGGRQRGLRPQ